MLTFLCEEILKIKEQGEGAEEEEEEEEEIKEEEEADDPKHNSEDEGESEEAEEAEVVEGEAEDGEDFEVEAEEVAVEAAKDNEKSKESIKGRREKAIRFFRIAASLHFDLQIVLINRSQDSGRSLIPSMEREISLFFLAHANL